MKSEITDIFAQTPCLTKDEMINYISGNSDAKEIRRIELHTASCPMCSDELEGFFTLLDIKKLDATVDKLNAEIDASVSEKSKTIPLNTNTPKKNIRNILSVAASLILLLSAGFLIRFYMNGGDKNLADINSDEYKKAGDNKIPVINDEKKIIAPVNKKNEDISVKSEEIKGNTEIKQENTDKPGNENKPDIVSENNTEKKDMVLDEKNETSGRVNTDALAANIPSAEETVDAEISEPAKETSMFGTTRGSEMFKKNTNENADKIKSLRESALLSYDLGIYDEALSDFNDYLEYKPADDEILYKSGIACYKLKKYDKALNRFNKITGEKTSQYFEDAEWYAANSLLKLGRNTEARKILTGITARKGKYKSKADELIKKIN